MLDPTCPSAHPHTFSYCSLPPAMSPFAHALDQPFLEYFGFESVHAAFRPSLSLPPLPNVRLFTVAVIRYLQAARYPFLMPVALRGRKDEHPEGPSGTRVFAVRKHGGFDEYTLSAAD